jgi:hypothetical protein
MLRAGIIHGSSALIALRASRHSVNSLMPCSAAELTVRLTSCTISMQMKSTLGEPTAKLREMAYVNKAAVQTLSAFLMKLERRAAADEKLEVGAFRHEDVGLLHQAE